MQSSGGDPTISLGIQVPQASGTSLNPLGTLNTWSEIQNRLNQNQLFQQTFQAKQRAGEIMSASPDLEIGLQQMLHDPQVAPFAGAIIGDIRNSQKTLTELQGMQQTQATSGLEAVSKAIAGSYGNPQLLPGLLGAQLKTLSPSALARVGPAANDVITSLTHGVDFSKPEGVKQYQANLMGLMLGSGMSPEVMRAASGVPAPAVGFQPNQQGQGVPVQTGGSVFSQASPSVVPQNPLGATPQGQPGTEGFAGPSTINKSYLENRGHDMADYQQKLDSDVQGGYQIMQNLTEAKQAMQDFKPGGGADTYKRIGSLAQAFGAPPDMVDKISNGNLGASTEFQKLMVNNVMGQLRQQIPAGSKLNQSEFKVFEDRNPNIDTDPRAIEKIFNFWTKTYGRARDEQASMNQYLAKPGADVSQWPAIWQQMAEKKGYTGGAGIGSVGSAPAPTTSAPNTLTRPPIENFFK